MNKEDRDRAINMINDHIENGKQLIRDKRILIQILEKEANKLSSVFTMPWQFAANSKRLESVYVELDRADHEIQMQRTKNTKLRDLRTSIQIPEVEAPEDVLLLEHHQVIVASHAH